MTAAERTGIAASSAFIFTRGLVYRAYRRLSQKNYERGWLVRTNETPAGSFRCYEPINRHGSDRMLAEMDADCGPSDVILDVGANVGIYALALTSESPDRRVLAVEPSPTTAERLRANVRLNGLDDRIDVLDCGLGDEDATRTFYRSTNPELSAFDRASAQRWEASVAAREAVPIRRLDGLVRGVAGREGDGNADTGDETDDQPIPPPDAIKIDVEGTAPDVLRGARETLETHRPVVFVEVHEDGIDRDVPTEVRDVLEDVGYAIRRRDGYWRCDPA